MWRRYKVQKWIHHTAIVDAYDKADAEAKADEYFDKNPEMTEDYRDLVSIDEVTGPDDMDVAHQAAEEEICSD